MVCDIKYQASAIVPRGTFDIKRLKNKLLESKKLK